MSHDRVRTNRGLVFAALILSGIIWNLGSVSAQDWPQWRGPGRLGVWDETGIIERFPDTGLRVAWRTEVGAGFAGPAVADGRVFVLDWQEHSDSRTLDGIERVMALDEQTGDVLWTHQLETSYRMLMVTYAIGPRATPRVDGDRVYVVGATGRLWVLDVESGAVIWQKDYVEQYGTNVPVWGVSSAPLVDGDRLITIVGGEPDALVVAFDKQTGEELWRAVEVAQEMGYGQPVIYDAGGVRQLIIWHTGALVSLDPATGDIFWEEPWEVRSGLSVMMRLDADRPDATMLWKGSSRSELPDETDGLHALITTPIILDDYVYGVGSYGELRGLSARTGERLWMSSDMTVQNRWGTAFMVQHRDRCFVNNDEGDLMIVELKPDGYVELDRTQLIEPTSVGGHTRANWTRTVNWSHPAYANKHIVHRNDSEIIRASLAASDY